ncbi:hybrid sensor histidine kinase/response regulator [Desulfopila aestuarii]|uniref:histidine kinase n=1 Tax=Desulfopila aestuarii DSM 18488 TaxID=1121416 RepID=A0A1M7Y380_9BACT|nr:ATP-binding protein [Desulfopila aestuarii]SHO46485.1 PAS domain S-box-containing protein [Desulfopila aestuarii DSM 18488]
MPFTLYYTYLRRCVLLAALLHVFCGNALAQVDEHKIFVLHSYHQEYPWTKSQNEGFVNEISAVFKGRSLTFADEYLDTKRVYFSASYQSFFAGYLRQKYHGYTPDLIFSTDDNALRFLLEFKQELFPATPVVFCGVNSMNVDAQLDRNIYTGVYEVKDIARNIDLIRKLLPEEETILVVGDNSETDVAIRGDIMKFTRERGSIAAGTKFEFVSENHLQQLLERLKGKKQGTILLTTIGGLQNQNNQPVALGSSLQAIAGSGDFVVISMEDAYMHPGVLGGVVTSGVAQGKAAAGLAVEILGDGAVSSFPPSVGPNVPTFDYRILQKLHIDKTQLPPDSVIQNVPRSFYQEFKGIVWATVTFITLLLILLSCLFVTILRRKKAERALAESEGFLNSVVENIPDMVFVKRADDLRFVRMNRTAEEFLGLNKEDFVGKTAFEVFPHEMASVFADQDKETLNERKLLDISEERLPGPDGIRYLHTKKIPIMGENGEPAYLLGISRDITKERIERERRIALEDRLIQAEKMESIGTLAGGIAHDFNNILSSVIGYAELARIEAENPEKVRKFLDGTLKGADRARDLIRQILTFSRKSNHQKGPVDLSAIVRESMKMLRSTLPATISIEQNIAGDAIILADSTQIQQILFNLCTNAYHAMMTKGGVLAVSIKTVNINANRSNELLQMTPGRYLRLEVGDTGVGMDAETRQRMFDPYYTTKGPEAGTGLGLAVVHGIVKSHNGHIHVYSEKGVGTTIHVYFPKMESQVVDSKPSLETVRVEGGNEHILLVDDEKDIIAINEGFLTRYGYQVSTCTDGREALALLQEKPQEFAAMVTDMTMPHLTGAELARQALSIVPGLPIILCTGHSEIINREKAMEMGISAYCEKPVRGDDLLVQLRTLLGMGRSR